MLEIPPEAMNNLASAAQVWMIATKLAKNYLVLQSDLNTLLTFAGSFHVIKAVEEYFARYNNDAPPKLLQEQIKKMYKYLENNDG